MPTGDEARRGARAKLAEGDLRAAYLALRPLLDYPGQIDDAAEARATLEVFAPIALGIGGAELGAHASRVAAAVDDPDALYDLAYALYEQSQYGLAATLLTRADRARPGSPKILSELASCLEAIGANGHAVLALAASGVADRDPFCAYLLAFNSLMVGDLDEPRKQLPKLRGSSDRSLAFMADALAAMLARADAIGASLELEGLALTAWHAVLDSSVLLHESPHGYEEPMRGRYAFVSDGPGLMHEGLTRLGEVLDHAGRRPKHLVAAPDRASQILGQAASEMLGLPARPWSEAALDHALVVAWNLDAVGDAEVLKALHPHRPGQVLFAHASSWTEPFPYAPDVTTLLYQAVTNPWTGGAHRVDPATGALTQAPPDTRPDDVLAKEIVDATITDPSAARPGLLAELLDATRSLPADQGLGLRRDDGRRIHQRKGSPVPSARFT